MKIRKYNIALSIFLVIGISITNSQENIPTCDSLYKIFLKYVEKKHPTNSDFQKSLSIVSRMVSIRCDHYELASPLVNAIIRSKNEKSALYYFEYFDLTNGSAEEDRICAFDEILHSYPAVVLKKISTSPASSYKRYTFMLAFGFANNYYEERKKSNLALVEYFYYKHPLLRRYSKKYSTIFSDIFRSIDGIDNYDREAREREKIRDSLNTK